MTRTRIILQHELDTIRAQRTAGALALDAYLSLVDAWSARAHRAGFSARYDFT